MIPGPFKAQLEKETSLTAFLKHSFHRDPQVSEPFLWYLG